MYDDEDSYDALNNDSPAEDENNEDEENEKVSNTGIWEAVKAATTSAEKLNILLGTTKNTTRDDSDVDMSGVEAGMNEKDMDQSGIFVNDESDSTVMNSEVSITNPANDTNQDVACDQSKDEVEKIPEKPKETKG